MNKIIITAVALALALCAAAGCSRLTDKNNGSEENETGSDAVNEMESLQPTENITLSEWTEEEDTVTATITMKDGGVIKLELYHDIAPITVENFVTLAKKGFYDGLTFHRIISGFMIQGGDPEGTGMGGPGYTIKGEFSSNGVKNDLKHTRGVISMARSMDPDSAGSQFFIMHEDAPHLDGQYAAFGKVIEGMDVVDKIADTPTDYNDMPVTEQVIGSITIQD